MGRVYAVTYTGTVTNAGGNTDLLSVQAADDKPVRLLGFILSQTSETGDAAEENLRITVNYFPATWTVGSGGSAVTAASPPADPLEPAWSFTARCNDTTVGTTSGTALVRAELGWNERNTPYDFWYPDARMAPKARQGEALVVRMESTPADDFTACLTFFVEEE